MNRDKKADGADAEVTALEQRADLERRAARLAPMREKLEAARQAQSQKRQDGGDISPEMAALIKQQQVERAALEAELERTRPARARAAAYREYLLGEPVLPPDKAN